jgi:repressor LexA
MASSNLTLKQVNVVVAIRNYRHLYGYSPSIRDLSALLQIARGSVNQHIESLEKKGVIRRTPKIARSLEVLQVA